MEKIINTTKYMKYIKTLVSVALLVAISPMVSFAQSYPIESDYADNSMEWDYADNSMEWDYADNSQSNYVYTRSEYYQPGYSYYPSYSYSYPTRSNWVGVGSSVTVIPGVQQPNYVYPTTPNYVQASFTGASPVYTQPTYVQSYVPPVQNQVLAYTDTNPSLDSVYLSDVPYTGLSDYYGLIAFMSLMISWSAILAYVFLKRKIEEKNMFASVYASTNKSEEVEGSIISNFVNQVASDKSDIREVEEYARMKKVLLSTDAATKIVKMQRLGKGSAKSTIDQFSKNDWVAVGEKDLIF